MRPWLVALAVQISLTTVICSKGPHHRRSLVGHSNLPVSKGGWRPVVGSGGLLYGSLGTAPLHAPSYKLPLIDLYPSSSRPLAARDVTKLTSIAQSYRPTTIRTVPVSSHPVASNQPINSYLNPFALPNGLNQYKFIQNFPELIRNQNQYNQYAARPVLQKQQTKQKQQYHNNILQQLTNVQPIQFGQYSTAKPLDLFGKPIEAYSRPDGKRPQSADTEIFKPDVFELPDTNVASQYLNQQVKTAQQQTYTLPKLPINQYGHPFQDNVFPNILGTFGSFGLQTIKGRDPAYPTTKTTFLPPQSTKQTLFNSFNYSPNLKTTQSIFASTTPKLSTAQTFNLLYGSTLNDLGNVPTPQTKVVSPLKIDPNAEIKHGFKPSPQDPFSKNFQNLDFNKITTYNPPIIQTSTAASTYNGYDFLSQNIPFHTFKNQGILNFNNFGKTKQKPSDNVGLTQQVSQQYVNAPGLFDLESSLNALTHRPSYAVIENISEDAITNASPAPWTVTPESYKQDTKENVESVTTHDHVNNVFEKPTTNLPEEYAIVTEGEKGYDNNYNFENQFDTQNRRPLDGDFEPIGKTKLKEYYYRVSTPSYEHKPYRRTKKPTDAPKIEVTTPATIDVTDVPVESLPTLPPNQHFKRPNTSDNVDRDKIRKRNKIRRRRPSLGNRNKFETSTRNDLTTTESAPTTVTDEVHTIRPRVRPTKPRSEIIVTTPTETTDSTTSALPTTSPTRPTVVVKKKMMAHRRPLTTVSTKIETTTQSTQEKDYNSRESSIMKISNRPQLSKSPINSFEFKNNETPDYSHKQDEKDTPTSDVSVSLTDTLKTDSLKEFSFHRDVRPVENKESTTESVKDKNEQETTTIASRAETNTRVTKISRPRLKNKFDRPKFSVKDYRNRLNSTTSTTEKVTESTPKSRFAQRKNPYTESIFSDVETTTERKKFTPKEPRHKLNKTENNEQEIHSRQNLRQKQNSEGNEGTTQKISSRIRNGQRKPRPTEEPTETSSSTTVHNKRPLRKRIQDSEVGESVQELSVTETAQSDHKNDITSERTRSESAIMKIADKKHQDHIERLFEHSKRVSDLTLAASKDYNTPGMFKTVASNSRRIPSYFTIATDDPILPIEAFFPQLNQKKES